MQIPPISDTLTVIFYHLSDPEQPFVEPQYPGPDVLGIYRHETKLTIPCRTTSPDFNVTLIGVSPHNDNNLAPISRLMTYTCGEN